jgi:hypothetical protein
VAHASRRRPASDHVTINYGNAQPASGQLVGTGGSDDTGSYNDRVISRFAHG